MRDRLNELKEHLLQKSAGIGNEEDEYDVPDPDEPRRGSIVVYNYRKKSLTPLEESFMDNFFHEVETTTQDIENIEKHVTEIRRLHSRIMASPRTEPAIQLELEDRMASIKTLSLRIRETLQGMKKEMEEHEKQRWGTQTSNSSDVWTEAEYRIRRTQHTVLSLNFKEALTKYTNVQLEYKEKHKDWLRKQMIIVKGDPTDEELEDIMEKGEGYIFTDNVLANTLEARQALADVQARHKEILQLEKSITELRDMFLEMFLLVEKQTSQHTEKAKKKVYQAKLLRSRVRTKKIIVAVILVLVAIVVALILYFTLAPL